MAPLPVDIRRASPIRQGIEDLNTVENNIVYSRTYRITQI